MEEKLQAHEFHRLTEGLVGYVEVCAEVCAAVEDSREPYLQVIVLYMVVIDLG